jgi:serine/threonine-protein kinase
VAAGAAAFVPTDAPTDSTSIFEGSREMPEADDRRKRWPLVLAALTVLALLIGAAVFGPMLFNPPAEERSVPSVLNMTKAQAEQRLEDAGLSLGEVDREPSSDVRKGLVLAQDPSPRSMLSPGDEVDITISTGDPDVTVPYVVGLDKDEARQELEDAGLEVRLQEEDSDEPADTVVRTVPERGTSVRRGSVVTVFYSSGPQEVPSVVGMREDRARRVLERAGFVPEVTYDSETVAEKGTVLRQSPEAYTEQSQGTRVVITVSSYEEPEPSPTPTPTPTPSESPTEEETTPGLGN